MPPLLVVYGTRPEALKLSGPVVAARARGLAVLCWHTGQSPDLRPDKMLTPDISASLRLAPQIFRDHQPGLVVVQGDTRTAFLAAVAAYEAGLPIFHVEAGVRSGDARNPCPEEGYRRMISAIARYHGCATATCWTEVLRAQEGSREHGAEASVRLVGNPIVENVRHRARFADYAALPVKRVLVTLHRKESGGHFGDIWRGIAEGLEGIECSVLWPTHPNGLAWAGVPTWITTSAPLAPEAFAKQLAESDLVITDSGGVQEEANALGVPCVVARQVTDRTESVGRGGALVGGRSPATLVPAIRAALALDRATIDRTIFGDGLASQRIADWWAEIMSPPPILPTAAESLPVPPPIGP